MEPLTILVAVTSIVISGALAKVGENVTDSVLFKSQELLTYIRDKMPHIAYVIENAERQPLNYRQAFSEIKEAARNDLELKRLLQEMSDVANMDRKVIESVKYELGKDDFSQQVVIKGWKGIHIEGGINTVTGNTFQIGSNSSGEEPTPNEKTAPCSFCGTSIIFGRCVCWAAMQELSMAQLKKSAKIQRREVF